MSTQLYLATNSVTQKSAFTMGFQGINVEKLIVI